MGMPMGMTGMMPPTLPPRRPLVEAPVELNHATRCGAPAYDGLFCWFVSWFVCWFVCLGGSQMERLAHSRLAQDTRGCAQAPATEDDLLRHRATRRGPGPRDPLAQSRIRDRRAPALLAAARRRRRRGHWCLSGEARPSEARPLEARTEAPTRRFSCLASGQRGNRSSPEKKGVCAYAHTKRRDITHTRKNNYK